jgi:Tol biopolymer transport system component
MRIEPPRGFTSSFVAATALAFVGFDATEMWADSYASRSLRSIAAQAIRADEVGAMTPAALSNDGRILAFVSRDHGPSRRSHCLNVYALDRSTGLITSESVTQENTPLDGDTRAPSLSGDGHVIAFESIASNLISSAARVGRATSRRVIVRNRLTGTLWTPEDAHQDTPDGESYQPAVSGNGLAIVFTSNATNLVTEPDANGRNEDIYLRRLAGSVTARISVDGNGVQKPIGASHSPSVSHDGEWIAFVSAARLTPEDTNDVPDVYLRDVARGRTSLVSRGLDGTSSNNASYSPSLSADGRVVAFVSSASNLAPFDDNHESDVFVFDVASGSVALVSATSKGKAANASSSRPALSADGRYVAYQSIASNLGSRRGCPGSATDTNLLPDVYLFDRAGGCVTRISGSPEREWWTPSVVPAIDSAGTVVVFSTTQPIGDADLSTDFDLWLRPTGLPRAAPPHETSSGSR